MQYLHRCLACAICALLCAIAWASAHAAEPTTNIRPSLQNSSYGTDPRQVFDLYPAQGPSPHPLVIAIHGGGFCAGDKKQCIPELVHQLVQKGVSVAAINYRLSDTATYPAQMHDAARAVQYFRSHAQQFRIDPERIAAYGESAGGGISMWLATHDDLADTNQKDPILRASSRISAAVGINAQSSYDPRIHSLFLGTDNITPTMRAFFGMKDQKDLYNPQHIALFESASPITHLDASDPPILMAFTYRNTPITQLKDFEHISHHPLFGHALHARALMVGARVEVSQREDDKPDFYQRHLNQIAAFLLQALNIKP